MENDLLKTSIEKLSLDFKNLRWKYPENPAVISEEKIQLWPGEENEDVVICVAKGNDASEQFHRQNFFFFNFAYKGDYSAISYKFDNKITVHEGECYIGQPYAGYAIKGKSEEQIIVGVLIKTEPFFKTFFSPLSSNAKLFRFFLEPQTNKYSDEFIQLKFDDLFSVRTLLEMMIVEYANKGDDTQEILKPLALTLMMQVARQFRKNTAEVKDKKLSDKIVRYMGEHPIASQKEIAAHFLYHPNYISTLLHKELGLTFSAIQNNQRMEKAAMLLRGTDLSIEEISEMLGYSNTSNFYKAFKKHYGTSPREIGMKPLASR